MPASASPKVDSGWLRPSGRNLFAAIAIAFAAFFLPQEIPLEWYPLNDPGTDINYLEITCAADVPGEVHIDYDVPAYGHRPIDSIHWPVSSTTQPFTYTFPLPDAPITEMRIAPPLGGALTIRQMRITNRRGQEIRRFTRDIFRPQHEIAGLLPLTDGWKIVAAANASAPYARIELFSAIVPVGMNHRNLLRCLLSTGYLAGMLTILLLAVLFVFYRPLTWRDGAAHISFMIALALCFACVGNRGLIRNSLGYARYVPPVPATGLKLELDVAASFRTPAQLFWDTGQGMNEANSARAAYEPHDDLQTLRFALPSGPIQSLRLDPGDSFGKWTVRGIRLVDQGQRTRLILPLASLHPMREIDRLEVEQDRLRLVTPANARDPITNFKPDAIEAINRTLAASPAP